MQYIVGRGDKRSKLHQYTSRGSDTIYLPSFDSTLDRQNSRSDFSKILVPVGQAKDKYVAFHEPSLIRRQLVSWRNIFTEAPDTEMVELLLGDIVQISYEM